MLGSNPSAEQVTEVWAMQSEWPFFFLPILWSKKR